jgi:phage head maturation protease
MAEETQDQAEQERPKAPIEIRSASVDDVKESQRIVTVIVAPYEQPTPVMWRDEVWMESFERSAWDGLRGRPNRIRANRAHDKGRTCGRATKFFPNREEGLVADIYLSNTPLGEETLQLAKDDCLSVSAGFAARPDGQIVDRRAKTRRIKEAYLDHISFVEDPAYPGAEVLEVRENELVLPDEVVVAGPSLDDFANDPVLMKAMGLLKLR